MIVIHSPFCVMWGGEASGKMILNIHVDILDGDSVLKLMADNYWLLWH
jgi:hypothetical protein